MFSGKYVEKTPTTTQKAMLQNAGHRQKKVQMLVTDNSEAKNNHKFPKLKKCGGFKFFRCLQNRRNLSR